MTVLRPVARSAKPAVAAVDEIVVPVVGVVNAAPAAVRVNVPLPLKAICHLHGHGIQYALHLPLGMGRDLPK